MIKTLLKYCGTGFDLVFISDSTSGHNYEFSSVKDAQIEAGDNRIISWEVGISEEHEFVLFITV